MCSQQRNARWWCGSTAADSIIEGAIGPTTKGIPREHAREQNASGTLATCKPIDTAITPSSPSLLDFDDSAIFLPPNTRTLISKPETETQRAPRLSRKNRLQDVLTYLRRFKLSPMDLFAELIDKSNGEYEAYRVKMYGEPGRQKLEEVFNLMMKDMRGHVVLQKWIRSHAFESVEEAINGEITALSAEFNTTTHKITPSYIKSWSFEGHVATVIGKQCPCLLRIIKIAAESNKSFKNSNKDTSVVSIC